MEKIVCALLCFRFRPWNFRQLRPYYSSNFQHSWITWWLNLKNNLRGGIMRLWTTIAAWVMKLMLQKGLKDLCSNSKHSTSDSDRVDCFLQSYSLTASGQLDKIIIGLIHPDRDWKILTWIYNEPFGQGMGRNKILNNQRLIILSVFTLSEDMYGLKVQRKWSVSQKAFFMFHPCGDWKRKDDTLLKEGQILIRYVSIEHI